MRNRIRALAAAALVAHSVSGGTTQARPGLPTAPPRMAPAGDQRGTAIGTDAALLVALVARPHRRRPRRRSWTPSLPRRTAP